jgi:hypothetical protein
VAGQIHSFFCVDNNRIWSSSNHARPSQPCVTYKRLACE